MSMHTTADDPTRYREDAEVAEWAKKDPIDRVGSTSLGRDSGMMILRRRWLRSS